MQNAAVQQGFVYLDVACSRGFVCLPQGSPLTAFQSKSYFSNMLLVSILCALLGISVAAKPVVQRHFNSTAWTSDYVLQPEEVILFGEGRSK